MDNFSSKLRINKALDTRATKNFSCDHYTSFRFFVPRPVYIHECIPSEHFSLNVKNFTRVDPMVHPLMGDVRLQTRVFSVPLRLLMNNFSEFITDTVPAGNIGSRSIPSSTPYFYNKDLVELFLGSEYSRTIPATAKPDFLYKPNSDSDPVRYKFTTKGSYLYDVFLSLGYKINFINAQESAALDDVNRISAMPLLAYCKIINDYYTYTLDNLGNWLSAFDPDTHLTSIQLSQLCSQLFVAYHEKDFFNQSWVRPFAPSSGISSNFVFPDITTLVKDGSSGAVSNSNNSQGSPAAITTNAAGTLTNNSPFRLSQYALESLKSLTNYLKRNQLAGSRALDRYYARFGIKLESDKLQRAYYLGNQVTQIKISDVTSFAATDPDNNIVPLGTQGGQAYGFGDGNFRFDTDEFAYVIAISSIIPHTGYYQGRSKHTMHVLQTDFYTPEFDNLGVAPIRLDEVFSMFDHEKVDSIAGHESDYKMSNVFGWSSRYYEYKTCPQDLLTGQFVRNSENVGLDSWHLMRDLWNESDGELVSTHNDRNFMMSDDQYNRVFALDDYNDHFITVFHFDVKVNSPATRLFDDYDFDEGSDVSINVGGTQLT